MTTFRLMGMATNQSPSGDPKIAERVFALRREMRLSQAGLGTLLNPAKAQTWVSEVEHAKITPPVDMLRELARVLDTSVSYLVGETDTRSTAEQRLAELGIGPGVIDQMAGESIQSLAADLAESITQRLLGRGVNNAQNGREDSRSR